mmetsp:Transcript_19668/g.42713  ORF Transcript_19668/g.42713 Transcript_19668/m.42713 type:complete len:355 (+) Transcript_19668:814-1878(+)
MFWVQRIELRRHARVPIVNFLHLSGIECDLSLDMSAQATSVVIRNLHDSCGRSLYVLSAFLKIYLGQLGLDKPFTGGLGSYKLYVLIAKHLERVRESAGGQGEDMGELLLSFLKHHGDPKYLNGQTNVNLPGAESVSMAQVFKAKDVREAFARAHAVLLQCSLKVPAGAAASASSAGDRRGASQANPIVIGSPERPSSSSASASVSSARQALSNSALGTLLNTSHLQAERAMHRQKAKQYPKRSDEERDEVARGVLCMLNGQLNQTSVLADLAIVKKQNPELAARLRSYPCVQAASNKNWLKVVATDSRRSVGEASAQVAEAEAEAQAQEAQEAQERPRVNELWTQKLAQWSVV